MKELTIEEKAKRYDEAIKVAKGNYETIVQMDKDCTFAKEGIVNTFHHMFPELKESGDEMVRKDMLEYCYKRMNNEFSTITIHQVERWLAWLEKQEKKSTWSEEDKNMLKWVIGYLDNKMLNTSIAEERTACKNAIVWLENQSKQKPAEPNPAWSEEDERMFKNTIALIETLEDYNKAPDGFGDVKFWLKSLKERYTWKPNDLPHWKKSTLLNNNTTGFNSDDFCHKGYCINYKELFEKLPKDD